MSKVKDSDSVTKRKNTKVKYSELEGEEIDEDTLNKVLGKTKKQGGTKHAFDGI